MNWMDEEYDKGIRKGYSVGCEDGYNKAIDDFIKYFNNLIDKGIWNLSPYITKDWLEQLKYNRGYNND